MRASGELDRADNRLLALQRDLTKATTPRPFYEGRVAIGEILQVARERNRAGRIRMDTGYEGHNFLEHSRPSSGPPKASKGRSREAEAHRTCDRQPPKIS